MPGEAAATETQDVVVGPEAGEDAGGGSDGGELFTFSLEGEGKAEEKIEDKKEEKQTEPDLTGLLKSRDDEVRGLRDELKKMNRAFYNLRQEQKAAKDKKPEGSETEFTDAQLLRIMEEHKEDPAVMLQVIRQAQKQELKKHGKALADDMESKTLREHNSAWIRNNAPDVMEDGSDNHQAVTQAIERLKIGEHPLAEFIAVNVLRASNIRAIVDAKVKEEKEKWLAESGEKARVAAVKSGSPAKSKPSTTAGAKDDASFRSQGAALGLTGSALDNYVQIRRNAVKNPRYAMEA